MVMHKCTASNVAGEEMGFKSGDAYSSRIFFATLSSIQVISFRL